MPGMVIVGAGLAGISAAEALRACGYDGPVRIFDDENEHPYDRPPLSKAFLAGPLADESCHLRPPSWYEEQRITLMRGQAVTALDPTTHSVRLADGTRHDYEKLLLATGARARALAHAPLSHPRMLTLRSIADARALRTHLQPGARIILVGGGVIGMECAATAARAGCAVTVLEAGPRIMARFFPPPMSAFLADRHASEGVAIHTESSVEHIELEAHGVAVHTAHGARVEGDVIIAGIGAEPEIALARSAGLLIADGRVAVDAAGQSSAPDIYAAGDCAAFPGPDGALLRWENWTHAVAHAQHVAKAMTGQPSTYTAIPWVWSDQFDLNIQVTGRPDADRTILRGDLQASRFTLFHLIDGRIVGATTVNNSRDRRTLRALVAASPAIPPEHLADASIKLQTLLPAPLA